MKVVTVHGTFAANEKDTGSAWWQRGSEFCEELVTRLSIQQSDIIPFHWTGENSEKDRRREGERLFRTISSLAATNGKDRIAIVSHSHGGNVVLHALRKAAEDAKFIGELDKWIAVATPFFESKGRFSSIYNVGIFTYPVILSVIFSIYFAHYQNESALDFSRIIIPALMMKSVLLFGILKHRRRKRVDNNLRAYVGDSLRVIMHPADEALFSLENASRLKLRKTLNSVSRGIVFQIVVSILLILGTFELMGFSEAFGISANFFDTLKSTISSWVTKYALAGHGSFGVYIRNAIEFSALLMYFSIIFILAFMVSAMFGDLADWLVRRVVRERLVMAAFGWDVPDLHVLGANKLPAGFDTKTVVEIQDKAKVRMLEGCNKSMSEFADNVRNMIAAVTLGRASLDDLTESLAKSEWKALIHNSYFDDKDVINLIVREIGDR